MSTQTVKFQFKRGTTAEWAAQNIPILLAGEPGIDLGPTGAGPSTLRIGDGITPWNLLPIVVSTPSGTVPPLLIAGATGVTGIPGQAGATGVTGIPGQAGATGATGIPGQAGATGATGIPGQAGATGVPGPTGAPGVPGGSGSATGPTGSLQFIDGSGNLQGNEGLVYDGVSKITGVNSSLDFNGSTIFGNNGFVLSNNSRSATVASYSDDIYLDASNSGVFIGANLGQSELLVNKIRALNSSPGQPGQVLGIDSSNNIQWQTISGASGASGGSGVTGVTGANGLDFQYVGPPEGVLFFDKFTQSVSGSDALKYDDIAGLRLDNSLNVNSSGYISRLVVSGMASSPGYNSGYYSDDFADSWNIINSDFGPTIVSRVSPTGIWVGLGVNPTDQTTNIVISRDGAVWSSTYGPILSGASTNSKHAIAFNGDACLVATNKGEIFFTSDITALPVQWSASQVDATNLLPGDDVRCLHAAWNPVDNVWWLFASLRQNSNTNNAGIYVFDPSTNPIAQATEITNLVNPVGNAIPHLFSDSVNGDAWCFTAMFDYIYNTWIVGGKGIDQLSSLAFLEKDIAANNWVVKYEQTVTNGSAYVQSLAFNGSKYIATQGGGGMIGQLMESSLPFSNVSWTTVTASRPAQWIDIVNSGKYWFAIMVAQGGNVLLWSDNGSTWDTLYMGGEGYTANSISISPSLTPGTLSALKVNNSLQKVGINTANPYATLDVRGKVASYSQYMNVGTSDNGVNMIKNNISAISTTDIAPKTAVSVELDAPDAFASVLDVVGRFRLSNVNPSQNVGHPGSVSGTFGTLYVDSTGHLQYAGYNSSGTLIVGPTQIA